MEKETRQRTHAQLAITKNKDGCFISNIQMRASYFISFAWINVETGDEVNRIKDLKLCVAIKCPTVD